MAQESRDAAGPCDKHAEADPACPACRREAEAHELADRWDKGVEPIPRRADAHALEILEWRILRRALVSETPVERVLAVLINAVWQLSNEVDSISSALEDVSERIEQREGR